MMTKTYKSQYELEFICIEDLVPDDHVLRMIDKHIDFNFIYDLVEDKYCHNNGRPSIDPVVLFKMVFISYLFGIRSMRRTVQEIHLNMAYRWFLGFTITDKVPDQSIFSKNYERRFKGTNIFQEIFDNIVEQALRHKLINAKEFFSDSTHLKANANKKKYKQGQVKKDARKYIKELNDEVNFLRKKMDKKPFEDDNDEDDDIKPQKISKTDPDSGYMYREGKPEGFFYLDHRTVDGKYNIIIDTHVTPGNVHDSTPYISRLDRIDSRFNLIPEAVALDSGYVSNYICHELDKRNVYTVMGYRRFGKRKGMFSKNKFMYIDIHDYYVCPNMEILSLSTIDRNGYKHYKSDSSKCINCPLLLKCTTSKNYTKVITRHIWEESREKIYANKRTEEGKVLYHKRGETVERSFADSKELHGLRYIRYRGIEKASGQALLTSACQNMKKIATILDKREKNLSLKQDILHFIKEIIDLVLNKDKLQFV